MAGATGLEPATFGVTGHKIPSRNQYRLQVLRCKNRPKRRGKLERERCRRFGSGQFDQEAAGMIARSLDRGQEPRKKQGLLRLGAGAARIQVFEAWENNAGLWVWER